MRQKQLIQTKNADSGKIRKEVPANPTNFGSEEYALLHFEWTQDLKSKTYLDALDIRKEVFVEEQQVPVSIEIDDLEDKTLHLVGYEESVPVATARIYPMAKRQIQGAACRHPQNRKGKKIRQHPDAGNRKARPRARRQTPVPRSPEPCHRFLRKSRLYNLRRRIRRSRHSAP